MYKYSDYVYDTGFADGEAVGILKGKAEAKREGILVGYVNCMRAFMEGQNMSFDDAANELGIPDADRPALRKELSL